MAWKPKTVAGKVLKGAVIGGGSLLALATGNSIIKGIVSRATTKGTAELATKVGTSPVSLSARIDRFKENAVNLITGKTKAIRQEINRAKVDARESLMKSKAAERLVELGRDPAEARSLVGLSSDELDVIDGKPIKSNNMVMWGIAALAAAFLLPKLLKIR